MKVTYELTSGDFEHYWLYNFWDGPSKQKGLREIRWILAFIIAAFVNYFFFLLFGSYLPNVKNWYWLIVPWVVFFYFVIALPIKAYLRYLGRKSFQANTDLRGQLELELTPEGLFFKSAFTTGERPWPLVDRVEETERMMIVFLIDKSAYLIPKKYFTLSVTSEQFKAFIVSHLIPKEIKIDVSDHLIPPSE